MKNWPYMVTWGFWIFIVSAESTKNNSACQQVMPMHHYADSYQHHGGCILIPCSCVGSAPVCDVSVWSETGILSLDGSNSFQAAAMARWLFPSSWQKEKKRNFSRSAVCSGATEAQHWHAADTTSQHATPSAWLCKLVNSSTTAIIKVFWLITHFNWTIPVSRVKKMAFLLAQLQNRVNAQTNKQTNEDTNKRGESSIGMCIIVRSREEVELIRRHLSG